MADTYTPIGQWEFDNAAFTSAMVGGTFVVAGSPQPLLNGTFTITIVLSPTTVIATPAPLLIDPALVEAASITLTYTPGADAAFKISGVSLQLQAKGGLKRDTTRMGDG